MKDSLVLECYNSSGQISEAVLQDDKQPSAGLFLHHIDEIFPKGLPIIKQVG